MAIQQYTYRDLLRDIFETARQLGNTGDILLFLRMLYFDTEVQVDEMVTRETVQRTVEHILRGKLAATAKIKMEGFRNPFNHESWQGGVDHSEKRDDESELICIWAEYSESVGEHGEGYDFDFEPDFPMVTLKPDTSDKEFRDMLLEGSEKLETYDFHNTEKPHKHNKPTLNIHPEECEYNIKKYKKHGII